MTPLDIFFSVKNQEKFNFNFKKWIHGWIHHGYQATLRNWWWLSLSLPKSGQGSVRTITTYFFMWPYCVTVTASTKTRKVVENKNCTETLKLTPDMTPLFWNSLQLHRSCSRNYYNISYWSGSVYRCGGGIWGIYTMHFLLSFWSSAPDYFQPLFLCQG
jgi:hypothetical protein